MLCCSVRQVRDLMMYIEAQNTISRSGGVGGELHEATLLPVPSAPTSQGQGAPSTARKGKGKARSGSGGQASKQQ